MVAEALGYTNPHKAIKDHVISADRKVLKYRNYPKTGQLNSIWKGQDTTDKVLINESGLYSLILGSKLPSAIEFKHWVTSESLPRFICYTLDNLLNGARLGEGRSGKISPLLVDQNHCNSHNGARMEKDSPGKFYPRLIQRR